jgi:hypothetical protein
MSYRFRKAAIRRSIKLMLFQWVKLDYIAHETGSICLRGTRKGNRSWRCLLRRIADGELVLIPVNGVEANGHVSPAPPVRKIGC